MALKYMGLAKKDLIKAAKFVVSAGYPDPVGYMTEIGARIEQMYNNKNPGVNGRKPGTKEWVLSPKPYIAVLKWVGNDAKIYRVLPTALVKTPKLH